MIVRVLDHKWYNSPAHYPLLHSDFTIIIVIVIIIIIIIIIMYIL